MRKVYLLITNDGQTAPLGNVQVLQNQGEWLVQGVMVLPFRGTGGAGSQHQGKKSSHTSGDLTAGTSTNWLGNSLAQKDLGGPGGHQACPCGKESQQHHAGNCCTGNFQQAEGGDPLVQLSTTETHPECWAQVCALQNKTKKCWGVSKTGPQKGLRGWSICPVRRSWESWGCSALKREGSRGSCECVWVPGVRVKEMEPDSSQGCHWIRASGYRLKYRNSSLKIGRNLLNLRVTKHWSWLRGDALCSPPAPPPTNT